MKVANVLLFLSAASLVELMYAYPDMSGTVIDVQRRIQQRRARILARAKSPSSQSRLSQAVVQTNAPKTPTSNFKESTLLKTPGSTEADGDQTTKAGEQGNDGSGVLLGDIKDGGSTPIGKRIARILMEQESAQSLDNKYTPPASLGQPACKRDTCCQWYVNSGFFRH